MSFGSTHRETSGAEMRANARERSPPPLAGVSRSTGSAPKTSPGRSAAARTNSTISGWSPLPLVSPRPRNNRTSTRAGCFTPRQRASWRRGTPPSGQSEGARRARRPAGRLEAGDKWRFPLGSRNGCTPAPCRIGAGAESWAASSQFARPPTPRAHQLRGAFPGALVTARRRVRRGAGAASLATMPISAPQGQQTALHDQPTSLVPLGAAGP